MQRKIKTAALLLALCMLVSVIPSAASVSANAPGVNGRYAPAASVDGLTLSQGSVLVIDHAGRLIKNVTPGSAVAAFKTHFAEGTNAINVKNAKGTVVNDGLVCTGFTVSASGGASYEIVVRGDVVGEGVLNSHCYITVKAYLKGVTPLTGVYLLAADMGKESNGTVGTADYLNMKAKIKGILPFEAPLAPLTETEQALTLNYHSKTFRLEETSGTHDNTVISNGKLTLADSISKTTGTFTSDNIDIGTFRRMLASWNAKTNGGKLSLAVSFQVGANWSQYFSWGTWSSTVAGSEPGSAASSSDTYGSMSIDELAVRSGQTPTGLIRVRITLTKGGAGGVPVVDNFTVATPQMAKWQTVNTSALPNSKTNAVPMRWQQDNSFDGDSVCSPTTAAMALQWLGTDVTTETAATAIRDRRAGIYGNWSFAVAYAGEQGYVAYLDLYDDDMMKYALSQGCVIGVSTSVTSSGHLILVVGYDSVKNKYLCNDPNRPASYAFETAADNRRYFSSAELSWKKSAYDNLGVVYVFQGKHDLMG